MCPASAFFGLDAAARPEDQEIIQNETAHSVFSINGSPFRMQRAEGGEG
jgi:hypothetical protein